MDVRCVAVPIAAALVSGLLAGCGSGDETISSSTADTLHRQVEAVRVAVARDRSSVAESALANLRATITRLADAGELNPDDGLVLLTQVDRIAADIDNRATPTPTPKATPEPTPEPATNSGGSADDGDDGGDDDDDNGKSNGNGNGKGKGKGKGKNK